MNLNTKVKSFIINNKSNCGCKKLLKNNEGFEKRWKIKINVTKRVLKRQNRFNTLDFYIHRFCVEKSGLQANFSTFAYHYNTTLKLSSSNPPLYKRGSNTSLKVKPFKSFFASILKSLHKLSTLFATPIAILYSIVSG